MICEPYDVVVVPFPFTDRDVSKRRPALVVSSTGFNRGHAQLVLAMITSTKSEWPSDVILGAWRDANLSVSCKVRFKLFTLDRTMIIRKLGILAPGDRQAVRDALSRWIAIT